MTAKDRERIEAAAKKAGWDIDIHAQNAPWGDCYETTCWHGIWSIRGWLHKPGDGSSLAVGDYIQVSGFLRKADAVDAIYLLAARLLGVKIGGRR
jgi:hypothetical protein